MRNPSSQAALIRSSFTVIPRMSNAVPIRDSFTVRRFKRFPYALPAFPRMSSGTSGFFFCGMMLLPVQSSSGRERKPNSAEDQYTISSERRERCIIVTAQAYRKSAAKSRSETASMLFSHTPSSPSSRATDSRSTGNVVPASAPAPSGETFVLLRASRNLSWSRENIS